MCRFVNQWKTGDSFSLINITYGRSLFYNYRFIVITLFGLGIEITIDDNPKPPAVKDVVKQWERENGIA